MKEPQYKTNHSETEQLIAAGKLRPAFKAIRRLLPANADAYIKNSLSKDEETYKYLLHYLSEGYPDSQRDRTIDDIASRLLFINDSIMREEVAKDSPEAYFSSLRFERIRKATLQSRLDDYKTAIDKSVSDSDGSTFPESSEIADEALDALFLYIMTMFGADKSEYTALGECLIGNVMPFEFKAQVISALMVGNIEYFDPKAYELLLSVFESADNEKLAARALVALILIASAWGSHIERNPILRERMNRLKDDDSFIKRLQAVAGNIMQAHDTQRISNKMKNELLPEIMKLKPDLIKKLGRVSEASDLEMLEENPEWEDILHRTELGDKLRELTDIQLEGGDVMIVPFSNLKSFPFFNSIANWFVPFSISHHSVNSVLKGLAPEMSEILDSEGVMCDSDKFSFVFSLEHMDSRQRDSVNLQMSRQMSQMKEMMAMHGNGLSRPLFELESLRFIRDAYRFYKLFKKKSGFRDPFESPVDFLSIPVFGELLSGNDSLEVAAEFYFKRGYYNEAEKLFVKLDSKGNADPLIWQKIGYCHNAAGELEKAVEWYRKAELLNPDNKWLVKRLALCLRLLGNHRDAAEYYERALEYEPDNFNLLMNSGHSLLQIGKVGNAVSKYYHADYVKPMQPSVWRALAWAEIINGNFQKSLSLYEKLKSSPDLSYTDHINGGHAFFLAGNYKQAVDCYNMALKLTDYESFESILFKDIPVIEKGGGNIGDLKLLLDKAGYESDPTL